MTCCRFHWAGISVLTVLVLCFSAGLTLGDDPASPGRGRHGWGHASQNEGPGQGGAGYGRGRGRGRGGPMRDDPAFVKDQELFHQLLDNRQAIKRTVKNIEGGVLTVTESDDTETAKWIQDHVASMKARVEEQRPIHMRDPLFRAVFSNAKTIEMKVEPTKKGVRVTETSKDPIVAKLIQAHAQVVSLFLKNGHIEVSHNHALPQTEEPATPPPAKE